jgi:hypothetical protein
MQYLVLIKIKIRKNNMGFIKLSNIALYGNKEAKEIKPLNSNNYKKLSKELSDRINTDKKHYSESVRRSTNYIAY